MGLSWQAWRKVDDITQIVWLIDWEKEVWYCVLECKDCKKERRLQMLNLKAGKNETTLSLIGWKGCQNWLLNWYSGRGDDNICSWPDKLGERKPICSDYMKKVSARAEKYHVIARKNSSPGWNDDWQNWEDANCQNNKGYRQIPAWVQFWFQFQPGLKYFM